MGMRNGEIKLKNKAQEIKKGEKKNERREIIG